MDSAELPIISDPSLHFKGEIKASPEHFVVEEQPLYDLCGEGEHLYVQLKRSGMTTQEVVTQLAGLFNLRASEIGYAGLKDKHAKTTQFFSLPLKEHEDDAITKQIEESLPVSVVSATRHRNKLKRGHLAGNRFQIVVQTQDPEALPKAQAIQELLQKRGFANYYGTQRFGSDGHNAARGRELLQQRRNQRGWKARLLLSAYQSHLFNQWLAQRIEAGHFEQVLVGDVAKKTDTGGLFVVENQTAEQARLARGEITYTGPIFGAKMRAAEAEAGRLEEEILHAEGLDQAAFKVHRLMGSRRVARLMLADLVIAAHQEGLCFTFTLPKGAYATAVLREFLAAS